MTYDLLDLPVFEVFDLDQGLLNVEGALHLESSERSASFIVIQMTED
jgi:hypothetical protein